MKSFLLGRYLGLVLAIAVLLAMFAAILLLNYSRSYQIAEDAHAIHLASRQTSLSQQVLNGLYLVESDLQQGKPIEESVAALGLSFSQFDEALDSFIYGGELIGLGQGQDQLLLSNSYSARNKELLGQIETLWQPYRRLISPVIYSIYSDSVNSADLLEKTQRAILYGRTNNEYILDLTNQFALSVEGLAQDKTARLREIQSWGLVAAVVFFVLLVMVFIRRLTASDRIAQRSSEAKINFLANMSHEIRTPMNGVMGVLDLITDTELDRTQQSLVSTAKTSAEGLLHVLNDILDISKIEAGKINIEHTSFDIQAVFDETIALFGPAASDKNVELVSFTPEQIHRPLMGDPNRIRQVLSNILGNAVKFTNKGEIQARLEIQTNENRAAVQIIVSDSGIGMAPETLNKLFDPFTQADESTTRKYGGTGLGLSISKRLLEFMGGQINVSSTLGKGSRFEILLNLELSDQDFGANAAVQNFSPAQVLVVDDNRTNLKILESYIKHWGLEPHVYLSAEEALKMLRSSTSPEFDLCLADLRMPGIDGMEMMRVVREESLAKNMKTILLGSANLSADVREQLGVFAVLSKPVLRAELHKLVSQFFQPGKADEIEVAPQVSLLEGKLLLVEDNKVNQLVAKSMLTKLGLSVDVAENGYRGLAKMLNNTYDLVLMDCQMPMMDGYEATRQRREYEQEVGLSPIPIVALTANAMKGDREKCIAAGMNDYLSKPIRPEELRQKLESWLSSKDSVDS